MAIAKISLYCILKIISHEHFIKFRSQEAAWIKFMLHTGAARGVVLSE